MRYKLVPVEPTREMWAASGDAVVAMNSQHHDAISEAVYKAMLAAAPEVEQEPAGWVVVGPDGCMSGIQTDHCHAVDLKSDMDSELPPHHAGPAHEVKRLYLHPNPAPDVAKLIRLLDSARLYVADVLKDPYSNVSHAFAKADLDQIDAALADYHQLGGDL